MRLDLETFERSIDNSGALLNTDMRELAAYKKRKQQLRKLEELEQRIDTLQENLTNEIERLLNKMMSDLLSTIEKGKKD